MIVVTLSKILLRIRWRLKQSYLVSIAMCKLLVCPILSNAEPLHTGIESSLKRKALTIVFLKYMVSEYER